MHTNFLENPQLHQWDSELYIKNKEVITKKREKILCQNVVQRRVSAENHKVKVKRGNNHLND